MITKNIAPFAKPLYVMIKPIGAICNLKCDYCYYLDTIELYSNKEKFKLNDQLLEKFVKEYLEAQSTPYVVFTWHGGEPLLRNIDFYKKAIELQKKYAEGREVQNILQTNGTLINDAWCEFFKENNFLIGISVDGTEKLHNRYRLKNDGKPSFNLVMNGVALLKRHNVDYNVMAVVNDYNVDYPLEFYRFFKEIGAHYIQFSPVVETFHDGSLAPWSIPSEKWGDFLITIFDEWVRNDVGNYFIQYFDTALASWMNQPVPFCIFAETCGHAGVMEFNGDVYSCDHFVKPEYKLGNINQSSLVEMMYSEQQINFGLDKSRNLSAQCKQCKYLFACQGECPKNRISTTAAGEEINYLCEGYYKFFSYIEPYMNFMKKELQAKRSPANIMRHLENSSI